VENSVVNADDMKNPYPNQGQTYDIMLMESGMSSSAILFRYSLEEYSNA